MGQESLSSPDLGKNHLGVTRVSSSVVTTRGATGPSAESEISIGET